MAASGFLLFAIMVGVGAPAANAFATAYAGIPNYGPSLPGWPSSVGIGAVSSAFAYPHIYAPVPPIPPIVHFPPIPNVHDMIKNHGIPGGSFQSFTFSSDGKGTTILTNKDGEVEVLEFGKNSPNGKPKVKHVDVKPVVSSSSYESGPSSFYTGGSTSSFSSSSDIDGKRTQVGGTNVITNTNGKVQSHSTLFDSRDPEE